MEFNKKAADLRLAAVAKHEKRVAELDTESTAKALIESPMPLTEEQRMRTMYSHAFVPADRFKRPIDETHEEYRPASKK